MSRNPIVFRHNEFGNFSKPISDNVMVAYGTPPPYHNFLALTEFHENIERTTKKFFDGISTMEKYRAGVNIGSAVKELLHMSYNRVAAYHFCQQEDKNYMIKEVLFANHLEKASRGSETAQPPIIMSLALEVHILSRLKHRNVMHTISLEHSLSRGRYYHLFEPHIPLHYYATKRSEAYPERSFLFHNKMIPRYIVKGYADALLFLFEHNITQDHFNYESAFIGMDGVPRLGEFYTAKQIRDGIALESSFMGLAGMYLAMINRSVPLAHFPNVPMHPGRRLQSLILGYDVHIGGFDEPSSIDNTPYFEPLDLQIAEQLCRLHVVNGVCYYDFPALTNTPDMSATLANDIENYANNHVSNTPTTPEPIDNSIFLTSWNKIECLIRFEINTFSHMYRFSMHRNEKISKVATKVICKLLLVEIEDSAKEQPKPTRRVSSDDEDEIYVKDGVVYGGDDSFEDEPYYHDRDFVPADLLRLYPILLNIFRVMVERVDGESRNVVQWLDHCYSEKFVLDQDGNRAGQIIFDVIRGERLLM